MILKAHRPLSSAYPKALYTLGDHLRKKRLDLGLLQKDVAKILGVNVDSVCNWENSRSSPQLHYLPKIVEFLKYIPFDREPNTLGEKIVNYRRFSGINQKQLAKRLGVDPGTLGRWERGKGYPLAKNMRKLTEFLRTPSVVGQM